MRLSLGLSVCLSASPTALADQDFHPKKVDVDGQTLVAFPLAEAEALLWVLDTRVPHLENVVAKYEKLDDAQTQLIETSSAAVATYRSMTADQRKLTDAWREAAKANAEVSIFGQIFNHPLIWVGVGVLAGFGLHGLLVDGGDK